MDGEPRNIDGVLKVLGDVGCGQWLWDYVCHDCCGDDLPNAAIDAKREKCKERMDEFAALKAADDERKKDPFPEARGFVVTHLCMRDNTLRHDFIHTTRA